jgi:xylulose-5-phosphate/fructose-6-phosphate phosphoketolase
VSGDAEAAPDVDRGALAPDELERLDAYCSAKYLSVGQIYLLDNPLRREPLRLEHVKPRLLGHWARRLG